MMIGQITDSLRGAHTDSPERISGRSRNLPLTMNLDLRPSEGGDRVEGDTGDEAYSLRIKFGGMFSNFTETTNIRIKRGGPEREARPSLACWQGYRRREGR